MRKFEDVIKSPRLSIVSIDSCNSSLAAFLSHPSYKSTEIFILAGWNEKAKDGKPMEHVSVSLKQRDPTWDEIDMIQDIFWGDEECIIEFLPPESQYVNDHSYCLHLWRKQCWGPRLEWE